MRTLNDFNKLVQESLEKHAERKGYNDTGADGDNMLYRFTKHIGASNGHSMGEIIYKATEYMKDAREVLLIKIAAWAFLEWKYFREENYCGIAGCKDKIAHIHTGSGMPY
jgi:hypothetical protein